MLLIGEISKFNSKFNPKLLFKLTTIVAVIGLGQSARKAKRKQRF
jgi:hypothetical protein